MEKTQFSCGAKRVIPSGRDGVSSGANHIAGFSSFCPVRELAIKHITLPVMHK